ncbi:hypothetical protein ACQ86N_46765 [Puia sp. P3]|uniref:hypothetical protein n=1 Tax=Puia sp. P3 TaxID=3423952 RepID=UPI003D67B659
MRGYFVNSIMLKPNREVLFNLIFWLLYFFYEWFGLAALSGDYASYFINACMALPLSLVISYLTVNVYIKRYYNKGRKLEFWVFQILTSLILLLIRRNINYFLIFPRYFPLCPTGASLLVWQADRRAGKPVPHHGRICAVLFCPVLV